MSQHKIFNEDQLLGWLAQLTDTNPKIVFTNGCFDILHVGHVRYLQAARALGSALVVGVNDDASVRALKGPSRPINRLEDRMEVLASLECVSAVVPMHSTDNVELMRLVIPHIWVKGGDYTLESLNAKEKQTAADLGTAIHILPVVTGYSTTSTLTKITC